LEETPGFTAWQTSLEIQFAGQTAHYAQIALQHLTEGTHALISGTIPAKLSDFKIDPPSLLAIPPKMKYPCAWK
jgi:hypothetical protein